jgi:hypothetical protein
MATQPTAQTTPSNWIEYPVQTPNGNYVNGRFDPASGEIQAQIGGDWQTISQTSAGTSQAPGRLSAPAQFGLNETYLHSGMGWALPSQQQVWAMRLAQQQRAAQGAPGTQGVSTGTGIQAAPSYWGAAPQSGGTQAGSVGALGATGGNATQQMATTTATQIPTNVSIPEWQRWYGQNVGKTILVNGQPRTIGTDIQPDEMLQAFQSNNVGWGAMSAPAGPQAPAAPIGGPGQAQPESVALAQMAQIDPTSEALRTGLGQSYLTQLAKTSQPTAADFQSLLKTYAQVDPTGAAARSKLGSDLAAQEALGTKLDAATQREVEQATRQAQIARGNVYGTPQLVQEAMTRGQAGLALQQQRQQALQGYLSSGQTTGDVAMNLYNQRQNQLRASQGAALGYLGSGQTPYQAGASYLNIAQQNAAMAAQGGPQYNPASLGQQYTGAGAPSFPQYGLDMSQLAGNWYNNINQANLQAYGLGQAYGQKGGSGMGAATGALSGAASGALAGSAAMPGWGTLIGAGVGAVAGGLGGYSK